MIRSPCTRILDGVTETRDDADFRSDLSLALRLADAADAQSLPRFDAADLQVSLKADHSHVTDADLATERAINPFLRSREGAVTQAVRAHAASANDEVAVFAALRQWKNEFR